MTRNPIVAGLAVLTLGLTASANAQGWGGGWTTPGGGPGGGWTTPGGPGGGWGSQRPSFPVIETPTDYRFRPGGGIDRRRKVINNTAFDFGRNLGRMVMPRQRVNNVIRDRSGRVIRIERGETWINPITGQRHGNIDQIERNGSGGFDNTKRVFSPAPN